MIRFAAVLALLGAAENSDWSQFRGPSRDGISPDTGLLKQWPSGGPPLAWKSEGIGTGYSSVCVSGTRLYLTGDVEGASMLFALGAADGKIAWKAKIGAPGGNRGNGGRGTPATDGTLVFALGQSGELVCAEAETGKIRWQKSLERDFGGKRPNWWWSESPLLDGDLVICTPGGRQGTVLALKKATGETVWQSKELTDEAHYTSLMPVEIGAVRQYLVFTAASVAGIGAKDGKLLWRHAREGKTAIVSTPLYKDGIVFVSSGYRVGCNGFQVTAAGGSFKAEQVYSGNQMENHHGGLILVGDHVYGVHDGGMLKCLELKTGKELWAGPRLGKGSIAYADGHIVYRSEDTRSGTVALVEVSPAGYKEKGQFSLTDPALEQRTMIWPHPVVFGGKLYLRNQNVLYCYDVKAK